MHVLSDDKGSEVDGVLGMVDVDGISRTFDVDGVAHEDGVVSSAQGKETVTR